MILLPILGLMHYDPRIDALRDKMHCVEKESYTADYLNPDKRSIANALQVILTHGTSSEKIAVEYPIGHRRRRKEGIPELVKKFKINLARCFPAKQQQILDACMKHSYLQCLLMSL